MQLHQNQIKVVLVTNNSTEEIQWSSEKQIRGSEDRRSSIDRRQYSGRGITVPDMRTGSDRRSGSERRGKVRLTITGRVMDI